MLASDMVGVVASLALLVPAVKDQYARFFMSKEERRARSSTWPQLRDVSASTWRAQRDGFDGWDSLFLGGGALLLLISFGLKGVGC